MKLSKISELRSQKRGLKQANAAGFTIVELMISTAVFSMVLLLCATAVVQIGRMFYKGTIINNTQNSTRTVADDVSGSIQFGSSNTLLETQTTFPFNASSTTISLPVHALCVGDVRYSYLLQNEVSGLNIDFKTPHVLWKDRPASGDTCTPLNITNADPGGTSGQELLGDSMRLSKFKVTQPASGSTWKLDILVAYGASNDVFTDGTYTMCTNSELGGQFCAVSAVNTYVIRRL